MNNDGYKYGRYVDLNQESRWATIDEIKNAGTYIDLSMPDYPTAGLPLISDGKEAYVDGKDTHTLIFGSTGSKKTRLFCMPLVNLFTKAGESFIVTDPKGEIFEKTSGLVKAKGYNTIVLNFRDIGKGDMWNPLALPYLLYHSKDKELGVSMLNDFVTCISDPQRKNTVDAFWPEMAASFALANLLLLMEVAKPNEANVASLAFLCNLENENLLKELADKMRPDTIAGMNYKGIFTGAERTKQSIYVSLFAMVRMFNTQKSLTKMLSGNTIDLAKIGREKTAVYLIIPDEKTTYHYLVTTFIKQAYQVLITEAQKQSNNQLPIRVNFVLDEFCNLPTISDMPAMISAARSRNIRYYLVAQSMHQLRGKYGEDADTIKGNCDNWVFLTSKELTLLNEVSELCGNITLHGNRKRRLISVSELQRLSKEKGEALIMHSRQYPIITEIADIDSYEAFKGYPSQEQKTFTSDPPALFDLKSFAYSCFRGTTKYPFSSPEDV